MDLTPLSPVARGALRQLLTDPIFEVIPLSNVLDQVEYLAPAARVSVTASPNKTLDDSLDLCAALLDRGFRVTPHLSARMTTDMTHLEHLLRRIDALGIGSAFVVGGDADHDGEFYDGLALLEAMEKIGYDLEIGIPAYPEGHPDIPDESLAAALRDKQGYATWMTTQMCFDATALGSWLQRARADGIRLPVVVGLPGAADRMRLLKISTRIGVGRSLSFLKKNTGLVSTFAKPGGYDPAELLVDLGGYLAEDTADIRGLHIYTFNQCDRTEEWRHQVLAAL